MRIYLIHRADGQQDTYVRHGRAVLQKQGRSFGPVDRVWFADRLWSCRAASRITGQPHLFMWQCDVIQSHLN